MSGEGFDLAPALSFPKPDHTAGSARQELTVRAPGDSKEPTGRPASLRAKLQEVNRGSKKIGSIQVSCIQRGSQKSRSSETGSGESGSTQIGAEQAGARQICICEIRVGQ